MEYTQLSADEQRAMLERRIRLYEEQHFDANQNLRALRATGGDETTIAVLEKQLGDLETCIELIKEDL